MKLNMDCMRDVLLYLENNLVYKQIKNQVICNKIDLIELSKKFNNIYDSPTIWYSVQMLSECGCIISTIHNELQGHLAYVNIISVTYKGHQLLESIKPEPIWNKTKGIVGKIGSNALSFVEQTAQMIAVESAKQAVKILMTTK